MDSLTGITKDLFSRFFTMFSFSDGFLMFSGRIKSEHWEESGQAFNSFQPSVPLLCSLQTSENFKFSIVSRRYKIETLKEIGEIKSYLC